MDNSWALQTYAHYSNRYGWTLTRKEAMQNNYQKCLETILHHEGGYVNHPEDPGGETNLGVTKKVYEEWGGTKDMKELTVEDVAPIYKKRS